jgi:galactokinase
MASSATASAPGRLDFLGGVGDYSGCMVLQVATAVSTTATASLQPASASAPADEVTLSSAAFGSVSLPLASLREAVASAPSGGALSPAALRAVHTLLTELAAPAWAFYVYGSLAAFALETGWLPAQGSALTLDFSSTVPLAQGVSSSASVEVATVRALVALSGLQLPALRLAHVAQAAENYVVGAPCGLMDQLASSLGSAGKVLPILCRPDACSPTVSFPAGVLVVGWPSGVEHSVGASPYLSARCAAFMAKKALEALLGRRLAHLAELRPSELLTVLHKLPESISGSDFEAQFGAVEDTLSTVVPEQLYRLRDAARFPVEENFR